MVKNIDYKMIVYRYTVFFSYHQKDRLEKNKIVQKIIIHVEIIYPLPSHHVHHNNIIKICEEHN